MSSSLQASAHNILTPYQRQVLEAIFSIRLAQEEFGLAGGTALAEYYFGHRESKDLDIFGMQVDSVDVLADQCIAVIPQVVAGATVVDVRKGIASRRLLVELEPNPPLQVDFASIDQPIFSAFGRIGSVNVLPIDQLALGKLSALYSRSEVRDAVDLYFLEKNGFDLGELRQKTIERDPGIAGYPRGVIEMMELIGKQIEDGSADWPPMLVPFERADLQRFLQDTTKRFQVAINLGDEGTFGEHRVRIGPRHKL